MTFYPSIGEKPQGWLVGFRVQTKALSSALSREMGSNTGLPAREISSSEGGPHLPTGSPPAECYQLWHWGAVCWPSENLNWAVLLFEMETYDTLNIATKKLKARWEMTGGQSRSISQFWCNSCNFSTAGNHRQVTDF